MPFSITIELCGGLGNQLFQLAALIHITKRNRRVPYLQSLTNPSVHSERSYFDSIFYMFRGLKSNLKPLTYITEPFLSYVHWNQILSGHINAELKGYFQDWRYIDSDFLMSLRFPSYILSKYEGIQEGIFIHIRGGDYVGNPLHGIGLDNYYTRAIAMFPGAHFFLMTNDLNYAMSKSFMKDIRYTVVDESELESMYLMSQCAGGICANSSFSWWGAFLNPNRKIVMPDRWYLDPSLSIEGYYFPGVIKCPV